MLVSLRKCEQRPQDGYENTYDWVRARQLWLLAVPGAKLLTEERKLEFSVAKSNTTAQNSPNVLQ